MSEPNKPTIEVMCAICQNLVHVPASLLTPDPKTMIKKAVFLHGNPIHGIILFVNKDGKILSKEVSQSIQIARDGKILPQLSAALHE
jgi:hypothetical protein